MSVPVPTPVMLETATAELRIRQSVWEHIARGVEEHPARHADALLRAQQLGQVIAWLEELDHAQ